MKDLFSWPEVVEKSKFACNNAATMFSTALFTNMDHVDFNASNIHFKVQDEITYPFPNFKMKLFLFWNG